MNSIVTRASAPAARVLEQEFTAAMQNRLGRLVTPGEYDMTVSYGPVPPAVREEAERVLATVGPLQTIGLLAFSEWLDPFFVAAASRSVSKADQQKHKATLWKFICDMPAEVFTEENQRRLSRVSDFVPTAARIEQVMGEQAAKVIATYKALIQLAEAPSSPPAPPAPAVITEEQRAAERIEVARIMADHKAWLAANAPAETASRLPRPAIQTPPDVLASWRAADPLVQAAIREEGKAA
jgi:hypothetical protein